MKKWNGFLSGFLTAALLFTLAFSALAITGRMTIEVDPVNIQVKGETFQPHDVNGKEVPVFAYEGTTYAPLRALAEAYGLYVGYDAAANMAVVSSTPIESRDTAAQPAGELTGTWAANMQIADIINEELAETELKDLAQINDFSVVLLMELKADGTYTLAVDEAAMVASMSGVKEQLKGVMLAYLDLRIEQEGLDMSAEEFLATIGMDINALMDEAFSDDAIKEMVDSAKAEGKYKTEGDKLYTSNSLSEEPNDEYVTFALNGDTLALDAGNGEVPSEMKDFLPLVFTRR